MLLLDLRHNSEDPLATLDHFWRDINGVLKEQPRLDKPFLDTRSCSFLDNHPMTQKNQTTFFRLWMIQNLAPLLPLDSLGVKGELSLEEKKRSTMVMLENCLKPSLDQMENGNHSEV